MKFNTASPINNHRVLFLSFSGVRVQDAELMALGLTLPGFVERSRVIASLPSLGLLTLAAWTPEHWQVDYREFDLLPFDAADGIAEEGWPIVAISCLTARVLDAYSLADELRKKGVIVIMGGLHVSAMPEEAALHVDIVVRGEGERVWQKVLSDIEAGGWQRRYDADLDGEPLAFNVAMPVPRYDLLEVERYNRLTLQTTRGCPLGCEFCGASRLISPYRKKSISQIRRELEAILAIWPRPFIELADDNTFVDKAWAFNLASLLAEHDVRWFTECDISVADDATLLRQLARSGCAQVLVGLETSTAATMGNIHGCDWKLRRHAKYKEDIRRIQEHGITVNGCFIVGFDEDGPDVFESTLEFIDTLGLAEAQVTLLTPFPGTGLRDRLKSQGRLLANESWNQHTLFDVTFHPAKMSVEELRSGFRWLMMEVYSQPRLAIRREIKKKCARIRSR